MLVKGPSVYSAMDMAQFCLLTYVRWGYLKNLSPKKYLSYMNLCEKKRRPVIRCVDKVIVRFITNFNFTIKRTSKWIVNVKYINNSHMWLRCGSQAKHESLAWSMEHFGAGNHPIIRKDNKEQLTNSPLVTLHSTWERNQHTWGPFY